MTFTRIRVSGLVQGVGFRPFVWRLARDEGLRGFVLNDAAGVLIEVRSDPAATRRLAERLRSECPPLARVDTLKVDEIDRFTRPVNDGFQILPSVAGDVSTGVVPDAATCADCISDVADPANRRHGYAFTNCTHCGPRLSIVSAIPYDRANTSMAAFAMCPACEAEYGDPANRRFHAQPNACPACGPQLWCEQGGEKLGVRQPLAWVADRLSEGAIIAIKGIGGFHLAVDARQAGAVRRLRNRKNRPHKPLALMVRDISQAQRFCSINHAEAAWLTHTSAPIVLLKKVPDTGFPEDLAPGQDHLGVMLPYSALHHLLMDLVPGPIVLTSGNLSGEPQVSDNDDARRKLSPVADGFLMHDRDILTRLDDSVMRVVGSGPAVLRRARGLAPDPVRLHPDFAKTAGVLAFGGDLKSAVCLLRGGEAAVTQHIGDLEQQSAYAAFDRTVDLYRRIYRFEPDLIAVDCHPDYLSGRVGRRLAKAEGLPLVEVQHHHAHLAACLAEAGVAPCEDQSLGIVLDGTGLGADGSVWGGELLLGGYDQVRRMGHFEQVALPGGEAAAREPWRNLVAQLFNAFGPHYRTLVGGTELGDRLAPAKLPVLETMMARGVNAPLTSSAGRLFDAVAAAIGVCFDRQTFEGQTGAALEALARPHLAGEVGYPVAVSADFPVVLSWQPMWEALLFDLRKGVDPGRISARFHLGLVNALVAAACQTAGAFGVERIVLSGGVMQNSVLLDGLHKRLSQSGFKVLSPHKYPANDGGLSLGQAAVAAVIHGEFPPAAS